ncbi:uncharacterized protein PITG_04476 [Phytophthora infestans T30-4]|uniref:Cysteine protease family C48 n=1 Tax=Phytophthora infestans (strain T30-4) TaxID=403677 RepID=D0N1C5_PHYIT|nr:uncharacterized protein PITG_04476 [Phytophthora infestans T30-4]EEY67438.1 conserved hypothetical protein [Phytophthora infestans T30-4]|eukprot:XP_002906086.1 conserved hypothetical protein [Phytophthora infestans T30-4]
MLKCEVLDRIHEAIQSIKATDNLNLLAHWSNYGCAKFGQLEALANVQEARNRFQLVQVTLDWIEGVEWQIKDVASPFIDSCDITKVTGVQKRSKTCDAGQGPEWCLGCSLLDFRENLWLHTSSVISAMLALKQMYPSVGVVNPSYHSLVGLSTKKKTAAGFGAMDPSNDRLIANICLDTHWVDYLVDKPKQTCFLFDPLQLNTNLSVLKSSVQLVIEPTVGLKDQITYQGITWCTQQGGNSCGICLYDFFSYLRMRYLHKAIGVQHCDVDEGNGQDE